MQENNTYVSLANKYRPQTFEDMVGQESISKTLQNALKSGRVAHAYLFHGPRGCGKTTTARILAKALNCTGNGSEKPTASPCGKCPQCLEIAQSADLDVLELDAASNTQVEKVREAIIDTVALAATRDRFKVFILDEVHMLSASSFNALLKTIEEPPAHVVFILAMTEKHKVPATIVSRCQTFRFRPLTVDEITTHLLDLSGAENIDLTAAAAKIIAKNAGGAMRDALTLLDRAMAYCGARIDEKSVSDMLGLTPDELIKQAVAALTKKDNTALHQVFETLAAEGFDANSFLKDLKNTLGDLFYFSLGQGSEPFAGAAQVLDGVSTGFLAQLSRKINKVIEEVKFADNALISAEVGLFTVMDSCLDLDGFIRRLEALENGSGGMSSGGPTGSRPATARPAPVVKPASVARPTSAAKKPLAATPQTDEDEEEIWAAAPSTPSAAAAPAVTPAALSNRQVWEKMLEHFKKSPFVYDVMSNCSVRFDNNAWTLVFAAEKAFYQIPAQNKLPSLEAAAKEISGRTIRITLGVDKAPAPQTAVATSAKTSAKQTTAKAATQPKAAAISDEEPFVNASFEKDAAADAPEEVKDVLDVFHQGELMA